MKSLALSILYLFVMHYLFVADKLKGVDKPCAFLSVIMLGFIAGFVIVNTRDK